MKTTHTLRIGLLLCGLLLCGLLLCATSAVAQNGQISVTQATYGIDSRTCDATSELSSLCAGKASCTVGADNGLCGDPAYGTKKELTVTYSCGGSGEARSATAKEHTNVVLDCGERGIEKLHMQAVAYGAQTGWCDATSTLATTCNGQSTCRVTASNDLCGDPNYGVGKSAKIIYLCNAELLFATVDEHDSIDLNC